MDRGVRQGRRSRGIGGVQAPPGVPRGSQGTRAVPRGGSRGLGRRRRRRRIDPAGGRRWKARRHDPGARQASRGVRPRQRRGLRVHARHRVAGQRRQDGVYARRGCRRLARRTRRHLAVRSHPRG